GWEMADDVAGVFASFIIMYNAFRLIREPVRELMDQEPAGVLERARTAGAGVDGVRLIEKSLARKVGSGYWIDMHVQVDPALSVPEAHAIAQRVKDAIRADQPLVRDVLVHVEPFENERTAGPLTP